MRKTGDWSYLTISIKVNASDRKCKCKEGQRRKQEKDIKRIMSLLVSCNSLKK
jgi:hypothetical protein